MRSFHKFIHELGCNRGIFFKRNMEDDGRQKRIKRIVADEQLCIFASSSQLRLLVHTFRRIADKRAYLNFYVSPVFYINPCFLGLVRKSRYALTPEKRRFRALLERISLFSHRFFCPCDLRKSASWILKRGRWAHSKIPVYPHSLVLSRNCILCNLKILRRYI